jgi:hypothetical protein
MHEMFQLATMHDIAAKKFPELFSVLLIALGCYVGTSPPIYTPQNTKSKKDKSTFVPNRNAYRLIPARYGILINYTCKVFHFFMYKLAVSFTEQLKVCRFSVLKKPITQCKYLFVF